jgi:hypothetical protein
LIKGVLKGNGEVTLASPSLTQPYIQDFKTAAEAAGLSVISESESDRLVINSVDGATATNFNPNELEQPTYRADPLNWKQSDSRQLEILSPNVNLRIVGHARQDQGVVVHKGPLATGESVDQANLGSEFGGGNVDYGAWARRAYRNLIYFHEIEKGGHFAAWEQPELFAAELRAAFRSLRKQQSLMYFKTADVAGGKIFYREAGELSKLDIE